MSFSKVFLVVCVFATVFHSVQKGREHVAVSKIKPDGNGFVALAAPQNAPVGKVLILAPANCPREAGRRADALERSLKQSGIPYLRTDSASFMPTTPVENAVRNQVMNGEVPVVFVGNRARNSPEVAEIINEFKTAGRR